MNAEHTKALEQIREALEPFEAIYQQAMAFGHSSGSTCQWKIAFDDLCKVHAALSALSSLKGSAQEESSGRSPDKSGSEPSDARSARSSETDGLASPHLQAPNAANARAYYLDTEFYEDGRTVELISIGIVCDDGRELYLENADFDWERVPKDHWVQTNVRPRLTNDTEPMSGHFAGASRSLVTIREKVRAFVPVNDNPVFYGYFADYDWVAFCRLFGTMSALPQGFPMFCMDLKQMMEERGLTSEWKAKGCPDPPDEHNALSDARWNKSLHAAILLASRGSAEVSEEEIERIADEQWELEAAKALGVARGQRTHTATLSFDKASFKRGLLYAIQHGLSHPVAQDIGQGISEGEIERIFGPIPCPACDGEGMIGPEPCHYCDETGKVPPGIDELKARLRSLGQPRSVGKGDEGVPASPSGSPLQSPEDGRISASIPDAPARRPSQAEIERAAMDYSAEPFGDGDVDFNRERHEQFVSALKYALESTNLFHAAPADAPAHEPSPTDAEILTKHWDTGYSYMTSNKKVLILGYRLCQQDQKK